MKHMRLPTCFLILASVIMTTITRGQTLPGTQPLDPNPDFSVTMVAGIDKMALRLIEQSKTGRKPTREKLKAAIGIVDERVGFAALDLMGDTNSPALLHESETYRVFRVWWPVFDGVHGGGRGTDALFHPGNAGAVIVTREDARASGA